MSCWSLIVGLLHAVSSQLVFPKLMCWSLARSGAWSQKSAVLGNRDWTVCLINGDWRRWFAPSILRDYSKKSPPKKSRSLSALDLELLHTGLDCEELTLLLMCTCPHTDTSPKIKYFLSTRPLEFRGRKHLVARKGWDNLPQTGWFTQQKSIVLPSWRPDSSRWWC